MKPPTSQDSGIKLEDTCNVLSTRKALQMVNIIITTGLIVSVNPRIKKQHASKMLYMYIYIYIYIHIHIDVYVYIFFL